MAKFPILYSFRRCPYAMRARMALFISNITCELREVKLSNKPSEMLSLSSKGTVPVLLLEDGSVIDESLDIMFWALEKNDTNSLFRDYMINEAENKKFLNMIDIDFKYALDRYKYPNRYDNVDPIMYREICHNILIGINDKINENNYIYGKYLSFIDIATLPFIRQFRIADPSWFDNEMPQTKIKNWLTNFLNLPIFRQIMTKYPEWVNEKEQFFFPNNGAN
ncbi:MAG: hypothetical protein CBC47_05760 [Alphaproteobacteria bacterium TMED87]|nr:glutathione S-transferase [Rhodospirillaceae bacterium]OUV09147.1 MAG: hypothetical protein CBC47_05760 [Alphaproteobacteria bacterium TMED87]|tara:strand:- start:7507 stop:8172 length:666 start_codon:yes stop_codon:yes gene_type:complete